MINHVIKRNGKKVKFQADKLNKLASWATEHNVSWSPIALNGLKKLSDGCSVGDIIQALIKACLDERTDSHLKVAGKLYVADLYKRVFSDNDARPPSLKEHILKMNGLNYYAVMDYTDAELEQVDALLRHNDDFTLSYTQINQMESKYLIRNRSTNTTYETPQFMYARIALAIFEKSDNRMYHIQRYLHLLQSLVLSLPSPNWSFIGTINKTGASCCLFAAEDTATSIAANNHIVEMMTIAGAGLGNNLMIRSMKDTVKGGTIEHMGKLPYYKAAQGIAKSNKQGPRGGALTTFASILDPEIFKIIKARNPTTLSEDRVDEIDYNITYNHNFIEAVRKNKEWMLISIQQAPDLYKAFYSENAELFDELYAKYLNDPSVKKEIVKARELGISFAGEQFETGRLYSTNSFETNYHTPFIEAIHSSNLCVAPESLLLTRHGYQTISELEGENVEVWNGAEWSSTVVVKTGTDQKLLKVTTDSGYTLDCTPYHKFYIFDGYGKDYKEVRAHELKEGDKLAKFELPLVSGYKELEQAYANGFYSGDGCLSQSGQRIYLYGEKRKLADKFLNGSSWTIQEQYDRQYIHYKNLQDKFFVPLSGYSVQSRLDWLAGYLDADGCVYTNGSNQALNASSVELEFLKDVQILLQTLGVSSKIKEMHKEGFRNLPANDGTGELKSVWCKTSYRLLITSNDSYKLLTLGLKLNRLEIKTSKPQRDAKQFVKILSVVDEGRTDDTYCVNEPLAHKAMFNGILTGQCAEITLPTKPFHDTLALYEEFSSEFAYLTLKGVKKELVIKDVELAKLVLKDFKVGDNYAGAEILDIKTKNEIALCNIAAINLNRDFTDEEYVEACYYALRTTDYVIYNSEYTFPNVEYTAKKRMSAGIGVMNYAYELARNELFYSTKAAKQHTHFIAERHFYSLVKASLLISKERGNAPWIHKTKWPDGWMPLDTYNKGVDEIFEFSYKYDWGSLKAEVIANGGIAHSALAAHMPGESSSQNLNSTNSWYPIRQGNVLKTDGGKVNIFIAPEWERLQNFYELAWDVPTFDMVDHYAIIQKFTDQSISADYWHDFTKEGQEVLTTKKLLTDLSYKNRKGLKTQYYANSRTKDSDKEDVGNSAGCASGSCSL